MLLGTGAKTWSSKELKALGRIYEFEAAAAHPRVGFLTGQEVYSAGVPACPSEVFIWGLGGKSHRYLLFKDNETTAQS